MQRTKIIPGKLTIDMDAGGTNPTSLKKNTNRIEKERRIALLTKSLFIFEITTYKNTANPMLRNIKAYNTYNSTPSFPPLTGDWIKDVKALGGMEIDDHMKKE
ncbi:MAG: hypothetical protein HQL24_09370 [Candidatus Omnitrophica bacterium]|nr:hypothetical protein [Candidatus Omnitrophota bacterium]